MNKYKEMGAKTEKKEKDQEGPPPPPPVVSEDLSEEIIFKT